MRKTDPIEKERKINSILLSIARGNSLHKSCEIEKVNPKVWYDWVKNDNKLREQFDEANEKKSFFEMERITAMRDMVYDEIMSSKNIKWALEYLSKTDPTFQKDNKVKTNVNVDLSDLFKLVGWGWQVKQLNEWSNYEEWEIEEVDIDYNDIKG